MDPRILLRLEGATAFVVATGAYVLTDNPWWLFLGAFVAPDISLVGFLIGDEFGSSVYNLAHTYVTPLALGGLGVWTGRPLLLAFGLAWTAHLGAERFFGYGLKYGTDFADTHLRRLVDPALSLVVPDVDGTNS